MIPDDAIDAAALAADLAARARAREDLDTSLVLEAGAGTGKTTLLTDRLLHLIARKGIPIERIVAITFTEKAAAEMKVRLREELEKEVAGAAEGEAPAAQVALYRTALENLALANVSTIHAFAASLLRERPVEAGVDPGFEVLDAVGAKRLFDEVWTRWEERELRERAEPYRRALAGGVGRDRVRRLADCLNANRELFPDALDSAAPGGALDDALAEFGRAAEALDAFALAMCRHEGDLLREAICGEALAARAFLARPRAEQEALLLGEGFKVRPAGGKGKTSNWKEGSLAEGRARLKALAEASTALAALMGADVAHGLAMWLGGFLDALGEEKARRGVLDFHDLLLFSRNLLRDQPAVRAEFQARFPAILVDEFQDTDPLQTEILFFLAEGRGSAAEWSDAAIGPGRLFVVGDPKQSVYRFRRADIDVYAAVRDRVAPEGPLRITKNYRSVPGIVAWANRLFADLFAPSDDALSQAEFTPIVPHRGAGDASEPPILLIAPPANTLEPLPIDVVRRHEAEAIAATLSTEIDAGRLEARDVAILFRSMIDVPVYEDALAARGIDLQVEGGKAFFQRAEVQALLACLTAADDPEDPLALVAALHSAHFGVSDDDLALLAADGRPFRYLDDPGPSHPAIAESFARLRELHARRQEEPLHRLVERVLEEAAVLELHALRGGGRRAVANLRKVVEKARAFEAAGAATPRAFVRWLREEEEDAVEGDSPAAEPEEGLVTLTTVHRAKGLEFPVVVLANLGSGLQFREVFLVESRDQRVAFSLGKRDNPLRTANFDDVRSRETKRHLAEERRILYVAITRARDRLVIPGHAALLAPSGDPAVGLFREILRGLPQRKTWEDGAIVDGVRVVAPAARLRDQDTAEATARGSSGEIRGAGVGEPRGGGTRSEIRGVRGREPRAEERLMDEEEWIDARRRTLARGRARHPIVTSRRLAAGGQLVARDESVEGGGEIAVARAEARRALGRFVHALLEALPGLDPGALEGLAADVAAREGFEGDRDEALALARVLLADPVMERARRAPRLLRELPFSAPLGDRLAEGVIDLAFEEDGEIVIVDYKTERVEGSGAAVARLRDHAAAHGQIDQMALYAQSLRAATGRPIREGILLYAREGASLAIGGAELMARALPEPFPLADDEDSAADANTDSRTDSAKSGTTRARAIPLTLDFPE